ncbi:MAG: chorismate pyruvate-lyase family protein [Oscillatoria sp. PMC 1068.18]|nr:chorismate pyruvate-lyase family protein [Oscillatoria sp. PMC 1076.18]MEC4988353.1 chorismate pyruvate-lyase family protein [Oscillatoria sp. PMC 1068.18]
MQAKEKELSNDYDLRPDLQESLAHSHIDPSKLTTFQRIILTTDGTLTEILEAYLFEKIQLVKLSEGLVSISQEIKPLEIKIGTEVIDRKILLRGKISRNNWIYAESIIVPERLESNFRSRLLESQESMGRLWLEHKLETFKEIVDSSCHPAGKLAEYFKIKPEDKMFSRTYRVFSNRQPIIMITEKFPESYFKKNF